VIAILLATARIAARRLQMTERVGADPDIFIGGRNRKCVDSRAIGTRYRASVRMNVAESARAANAPYSGLRVGAVVKARPPCALIARHSDHLSSSMSVASDIYRLAMRLSMAAAPAIQHPIMLGPTRPASRGARRLKASCVRVESHDSAA
jgi:hypothetical protein